MKTKRNYEVITKEHGSLEIKTTTSNKKKKNFKKTLKMSTLTLFDFTVVGVYLLCCRFGFFFSTCFFY